MGQQKLGAGNELLASADQRKAVTRRHTQG
jgi:hypothetical protein